MSDRGQRAVLGYDDRGNVLWTARQMALARTFVEPDAARLSRSRAALSIPSSSKTRKPSSRQRGS